MTASSLAPDVIEPTLSPSSLLLGLIGGVLFASRKRMSTPVRAAATIGGLALIGAAAHRPIAEAVRKAGVKRRSGTLALSFVVPQPVEVVFAFCRDFENFPQFIGALRDVRDFGDGRSHWSASTPSGGTIEWDTVTTKYVPNRVIAWTSVSGSPVETSARVRFLPERDGTCVRIDGAYRVVDSTIGDAIAALMTPQRKNELAADIRRLGSYLECVLAGRTPQRAGV